MLRHDISGEEEEQQQEHSKEGEQDGQSEQRSHRQQKIRELLRDLYKEHKPSKLDDVDNLMKRYNGNEERLYQVICAKYLPQEEPSKAHWSSLAKRLWARTEAKRLQARTESGPPEEAGAAYRLKAEARFQATADLQEACVAICVEFELSDEVLVLMRVLERNFLEELFSDQMLRKKLKVLEQDDLCINKEDRMRWLFMNLDKEVPKLIEHTGSLLDEERRAKLAMKDKDEAQEDVAERGEKRPNLVLRTREEVLKARLFARYAYEMERRGASGSGPV